MIINLYYLTIINKFKIFIPSNKCNCIPSNTLYIQNFIQTKNISNLKSIYLH